MTEETTEPSKATTGEQQVTGMKVAIIAAMGANREIGANNDLLWNLGEDMRFFKEQTHRHYIIMGRKNFESIPEKYRPLPNRVNIILSRDPEYMYEECYTCATLEEALDLARENGEQRVFIIGGGQVYKLALDAGVVDEMYLTHVHASFDHAEVFFPEFDESAWQKQHILKSTSGVENEYDFDIYKYEKKK